jgi:hypothetical protein
MMSDWTKAHDEPLLADILADPIVQALMKRDHVEHRDIEQMIQSLNEANTQEARARFLTAG